MLKIVMACYSCRWLGSLLTLGRLQYIRGIDRDTTASATCVSRWPDTTFPERLLLR